MAKKKSGIGVSDFHKRTPKKRPGRHSKSPNKKTKLSFKKYIGQGRV